MVHHPVLLDEMLSAVSPRDGETYADATFGGGGYSRAILEAAHCKVVALDCDPDAIRRGEAFANEEPRFVIRQGFYSEIASCLGPLAPLGFDAIIADIGVSSFQLDEPERGFSFQGDGPLDMRMAKMGRSAADLVNSATLEELTRLFKEYGEEPEARFVARGIVARRSEKAFETTGDLAALVSSIKRKTRPGRHPATQVFQALRIEVNNELSELNRLLHSSIELLKPGGRLVIVTFHSLEDRLVKRFIDEQAGAGADRNRHMPPLPGQQVKVRLKWLQRRAVKPGTTEQSVNPRSRSAKLRAAIKTAEPAETGDQDASVVSKWRAA